MPLFPLFLLWVVVTQGSFPPKVHHGCFCIFLMSYSVFRVSGKLLVWGIIVKIEFLSVDFGGSFISYQRGVFAFWFGSFSRICQTSPPCLRGRASICLSASLTSRPTRAGINWSLMAFSSGSNNSLASGTVLWKWVHLEDNPLVNAEYAAWWSSCAYFESNWMSFTQPSTLFLMYCSLNDCPNYRSKEASTFVCDFDSIIFEDFLCGLH